jgi:hypothetical protein
MRLIIAIIALIFISLTAHAQQETVDSTQINYSIEQVSQDSFYLNLVQHIYKSGGKRPMVTSEPVLFFRKPDELADYIFKIREEANRYRKVGSLLDTRASQIESVKTSITKKQ